VQLLFVSTFSGAHVLVRELLQGVVEEVQEHHISSFTSEAALEGVLLPFLQKQGAAASLTVKASSSRQGCNDESSVKEAEGNSQGRAADGRGGDQAGVCGMAATAAIHARLLVMHAHAARDAAKAQHFQRLVMRLKQQVQQQGLAGEGPPSSTTSREVSQTCAVCLIIHVPRQLKSRQKQQATTTATAIGSSNSSDRGVQPRARQRKQNAALGLEIPEANVSTSSNPARQSGGLGPHSLAAAAAIAAGGGGGCPTWQVGYLSEWQQVHIDKLDGPDHISWELLRTTLSPGNSSNKSSSSSSSSRNGSLHQTGGSSSSRSREGIQQPLGFCAEVPVDEMARRALLGALNALHYPQQVDGSGKP
jgi:hypothetical protein